LKLKLFLVQCNEINFLPFYKEPTHVKNYVGFSKFFQNIFQLFRHETMYLLQLLT